MLNEDKPKIPATRWQNSFAAILKEQAAEVMRCVTECAPAQLPVHLARLKDICALFDFAIGNCLVDADERELSGRQLQYCLTVRDYREALELTKMHHRAPVFVSRYAADMADIVRRLDCLAAAIGGAR